MASGRRDEKRRRQLREEVLDLVAERARRRAARDLAPSSELGRQLESAELTEIDPYEMARSLGGGL